MDCQVRFRPSSILAGVTSLAMSILGTSCFLLLFIHPAVALDAIASGDYTISAVEGNDGNQYIIGIPNCFSRDTTEVRLTGWISPTSLYHETYRKKVYDKVIRDVCTQPLLSMSDFMQKLRSSFDMFGMSNEAAGKIMDAIKLVATDDAASLVSSTNVNEHIKQLFQKIHKDATFLKKNPVFSKVQKALIKSPADFLE